MGYPWGQVTHGALELPVSPPIGRYNLRGGQASISFQLVLRKRTGLGCVLLIHAFPVPLVPKLSAFRRRAIPVVVFDGDHLAGTWGS